MGRGSGSDSPFSPDKGVVLQSVEGLPLDAYLLAVARTVESRRITHISRTREGVCVFLDCERLAAGLAGAGWLQVGGLRLWLRAFALNARRLLLANCLPFLSDSLILAELNRVGQVLSPLRAEPVRSRLQNFKHVLSFAKTVTIVVEDVTSMPDKLLVPFRGTHIPIYLFDEELCPCGDELDVFNLKLAASHPRAQQSELEQRPVRSFLARHPMAALVAGPAPAEPELMAAPAPAGRHTKASQPAPVDAYGLSAAPKRRASSPLSVKASGSDQATAVRPTVSLGVWQHQVSTKRETWHRLTLAKKETTKPPPLRRS